MCDMFIVDGSNHTNVLVFGFTHEICKIARLSWFIIYKLKFSLDRLILSIIKLFCLLLCIFTAIFELSSLFLNKETRLIENNT